MAMAALLAVLVWAALAPPGWLSLLLGLVAATLLARRWRRHMRASMPWWAGVLADDGRLHELTERARSAEMDDLGAELWRARRAQRASRRSARRLDWCWCTARTTGPPDHVTRSHSVARAALAAALDDIEQGLAERRRAVVSARAELDALDPTVSR
jgi:hypothetical protein